MEHDFICWAAGFFDGEGSISMNHPGYGMSVVIVNTYQPAMEQFKCFPGLLRSARGGAGKQSRHVVFSFRFTYVGALQFLSLIIPYLRVKRAAAEIALEYVTLCLEHSRIPMEVREDFYYRLQATRELGKEKE